MLGAKTSRPKDAFLFFGPCSPQANIFKLWPNEGGDVSSLLGGDFLDPNSFLQPAPCAPRLLSAYRAGSVQTPSLWLPCVGSANESHCGRSVEEGCMSSGHWCYWVPPCDLIQHWLAPSSKGHFCAGGLLFMTSLFGSWLDIQVTNDSPVTIITPWFPLRFSPLSMVLLYVNVSHIIFV